MKKKIFLDTMYIIRLVSTDLFEKVIEKNAIYVSPAILDELSPGHKDFLTKLQEKGKITVIEIIKDLEQKIYNLIRKHKGKEQAINYRNNKRKKLHDLGEYQVFAYLLEHPNPNEYKFVTMDKGAKRIMKITKKLQQSLVTDNEGEILGLTEEEIKIL